MYRQPLLSIIVPAYNAEETLKKTLLSVAAQMEHYPECEVLVIDDGSKDKTPQIISQFEQWDGRYKGIRQENRGVSAARNRGIQASQGDYIAFLDADDLFLDGCIDRRMKVFMDEDTSDMLGVFCPAVLIDSDGNNLHSRLQFDYNLPRDRLYFNAMPESVFNPSCVILKKSELLKSGGFDETITPAEDYDLWHRLMRSGGYFKKVGNCSIGWRQHSQSAAHSKILEHYKQCKIVTMRVFSQSVNACAEEYSRGFGESLYYVTITSRAFSSSIMAVVTGQYDAALEISADLKKRLLEQIVPERLEEMIRFNALRALSQPEDRWHLTVWPEIKSDVMRFITDLNNRLGGDCNSLMELKYILENYRTETFQLRAAKL
ncbi:MAG: hypothetical protein AMK71_01505 [Nitrospira bacterium SG8_35_4]|nr:MAG: hypothetical protein AMK71_01505 [Nitrospira bacterium SG8_35_4]